MGSILKGEIMTGAGLLSVVAIGVCIYATLDSTKKGKTALQLLYTLSAFLFLAWVMSLFINPAVMGTLAGTLFPFLMLAAGIIILRRNKKEKLAS